MGSFSVEFHNTKETNILIMNLVEKVASKVLRNWYI